MVERQNVDIAFTNKSYVREYARNYSNDLLDLNYIEQLVSGTSPGNRILDVGCGLANYSQYLAKKFLVVESIDRSREMLSAAKVYSLSSRCLRQMDMTKLGYSTETFDRLMSLFSLNYIPSSELDETLNEFYRVVKPGGEGLISVPYGGPDSIQTDEMFPSIKIFLNFFTPNRLNQYLLKAGFQITEQLIIETDDKYAMSSQLIYTFIRK